MIYQNASFLISVIIPAYNIEAYFDKCMESLENQTISKADFEVVIVDDCSTDDTLNKAKAYETEICLKIEHLDTNGGPGAARNKGLAVSQGEYIVFLDGDDLLACNALARLSELVRTHRYDLITFNWTYFSDIEEGGVIVPRRRDLIDMPTERDAIISHYLGMNMDGSVIYTMAKKSLFDEYDITFPLGYHEDMAIIFQMYYGAKAINKLDEVLYIKRNVDSSIVNTLSKNHVYGYLNAWPTISQFLEQQGVAISNYRSDYISGMSGHVCTLINKNYKINSNDPKSRQLVYGLILDALDKDVNLTKPYYQCFPDDSEKDKVTQLFCFYMSKLEWPLSERARQFEFEFSSDGEKRLEQ